MSSSINYEKMLYKKSPLGLLEARIRRFYNIPANVSKLRNDSDRWGKVNAIRKEHEDWQSSKAEEIGKLEAEFKEKIANWEKEREAKIFEAMTNESNILTEIESL